MKSSQAKKQQVQIAATIAPVVEKTLTGQIESTGTTLSAQIRALHAQGMKISAIAKKLSAERDKPVIYQHVRNVLKRPLKGRRNIVDSKSGVSV